MLHILPEDKGLEMVIGDRFFFKALDMHKAAGIVVIGIALAAHSAGAVLLEFIKITANDLAGLLLLIRKHGKCHDITYHTKGFWLFSRYCKGQAGIKKCCPGRQHLG